MSLSTKNMKMVNFYSRQIKNQKDKFVTFKIHIRSLQGVLKQQGLENINVSDDFRIFTDLPTYYS